MYFNWCFTASQGGLFISNLFEGKGRGGGGRAKTRRDWGAYLIGGAYLIVRKDNEISD